MKTCGTKYHTYIFTNIPFWFTVGLGENALKYHLFIFSFLAILVH